MSKKFTDKELRGISWRWVRYGQLCMNYGKMQGSGYLTTMLPVIDKLYGDNPESKQKALEAHSQFYNATPHMTHIILGMDIAIEESQGIESIETVSALKTSLMGPLSGIGDTIFAVMNSVVFGSIAATMAVDGNWVGMLIWQVWYLAVLFVLRPWFFRIGYKQGINLVNVYSGKLKSITKAVSTLGLIVVGSMISSMVKINFATINLFSTEFNIQTDFFDKIVPFLPQGLFAIFLYWIVSKKNLSTTKLIMLVIVISVLGSATKILVP